MGVPGRTFAGSAVEPRRFVRDGLDETGKIGSSWEQEARRALGGHNLSNRFHERNACPPGGGGERAVGKHGTPAAQFFLPSTRDRGPAGRLWDLLDATRHGAPLSERGCSDVPQLCLDGSGSARGISMGAKPAGRGLHWPGRIGLASEPPHTRAATARGPCLPPPHRQGKGRKRSKSAGLPGSLLPRRWHPKLAAPRKGRSPSRRCGGSAGILHGSDQPDWGRIESPRLLERVQRLRPFPRGVTACCRQLTWPWWGTAPEAPEICARPMDGPYGPRKPTEWRIAEASGAGPQHATAV